MDLSRKLLNDNLLKVFADAKKVGALDDSGAMLVKDFLRVIEGEIKKKRDMATETIGEIRALSKMSEIWSSILKSHTRIELEAQKNKEEAEQRLGNENQQKAEEKTAEDNKEDEKEVKIVKRLKKRNK